MRIHDGFLSKAVCLALWALGGDVLASASSSSQPQARSSLLQVLQSSKLLKEHGLEEGEVALAYIQENNIKVLSHHNGLSSAKSSAGVLQPLAMSHSYVTCSSRIDASEAKMSELEAIFGPDNLRIATVDHEHDIACFTVYGSARQASRVPESEWSMDVLPPLLKIHHNVFGLVKSQTSSASATNDMRPGAADTGDLLLSSVLRRASPEPNMVVVRLAHAFNTSSMSEEAARDMMERWESQFRSEHRHLLHAAAPTSNPNGFKGKWNSLLDSAASSFTAASMGASVPSSTAESATCSVNSISEEVLYYKGYFELREVHHFTSSAQGRYCIANFIDFMSNDHRVQLVSAQSMPELLNYHGQGLAQTGDPGNRILSEAGLTGLADIVGVADSGINDNSCYFFDNSGAYGAGTVTRTALGNFNREPLRRKVIQYVAYGDGYDSIGGHGTHVVGTIVGDALNSDYSASNGVAPGAKVIFLDVEKAGSPYLLIPALDEGLLYQQYKSGARVFSNSWGSYSTDMYAERSYEVDGFLYNNPDSLAVFAAGNTGTDGMDTLYNPCDSKNVLCVGSIDAVDDFTDEVITDDVRVSYFSSLGPTFDGRFKPDVVAPGFKVVSAMAPEPGSSRGCSAIEMFGTSMATPLVSGLVLLARQYFNGGLWKSLCRSDYTSCINFMPSGMLSKALIIHSAEGVKQYSHPDFDGATVLPSTKLNNPPDFMQGFGAVRLGNILPTTAEAAQIQDLYVVDLYSISSYSTHTLKVHVSSSSRPLKVTLVWYDRPNAIGTADSLLIDNLDLTVVSATGYIYYGNNHEDKKNTVERVVIDTPEAGRFYTVVIKAGAFTGGISQRFALVVSCTGHVMSQLKVESRRLDEILADAQELPEATKPLLATPDLTLAGATKALGGAESSRYSLRGLVENAIVQSRKLTWYDSDRIVKDFEVTLPALQAACFEPFEITNEKLKLYSIEINIDSEFIGGSDAFVLAAVITSPSGEKIQVGGYQHFASASSIWVRNWPISWIGAPPSSLYGGYRSTRLVYMAGQGPSPLGEWKICLQLLYAGWKDVTYKGTLSLQFDEEDDSQLVDSVLEAASWIDQLETSVLILLSIAAALLVVPPVLDCLKVKGPKGSVELNHDSSHTGEKKLLPKNASSSPDSAKTGGKKFKRSEKAHTASGKYAPVSNPMLSE